MKCCNILHVQKGVYEMKKVGIVTIQSVNFGNRLQNYALQEVIKKLGYDVYTLRRFDERFTRKEKIIYNIKIGIQYLLRSKRVNFAKFDKNIKFSKYKVGVNYASAEIKDSFDFFIAGSDQVWNPSLWNVGKCDLLDFAYDNQRISYAASLGVKVLPKNKGEILKKELTKFKAISVREEEAKVLLENLISNKIEVVLDPTLLLDAASWKKMHISTSLRPKKKFCFVYSLKEKSQALKNKIAELSTEYEIIDIMEKNFLGISRRLGPGEFLYLLSWADIVLTNSFHATVFSILYDKDVYSFNRGDLDMNSRIKSLAQIIGFPDNFDEEGTFFILSKLERQLANRNIENERSKSIEFLRKSLL